jgi:hypothetical protein
MAVRDQSCNQCGALNCSRHNKLPNSITDRLSKLLEHFESPENDEMRTFIRPEKHLAPNSIEDDTSEASVIAPTAIMRTANDNVVPMPRSTESITGKEIVLIGSSATTQTDSTKLFSGDSVNGNKPDSIIKLSNGKGVRAHERHHFIHVNGTSFTSCISPSGEYSEMALVIWVDSKQYQKHQYSTERYRVVISLMYDAEEDLWSVSAKLIKRFLYGARDEEEGQISNRLCVTSEIRTEIKKMLLYLGISPRDTYKFFRRNMEENFVVCTSEFGFTTVECESHSKLMKDLEKTTSTTNSGWDHHGGYYGGHGNMHSRQPGRDQREHRDKIYHGYEEIE